MSRVQQPKSTRDATRALAIQCETVLLTKMAESRETVRAVDGGDTLQVLPVSEVSLCRSEFDTSESVGCFGRPGSQLEEKLEFKSKDGKSIWAVPVLVDFRRLLELGQISESSGVIPGVRIEILLFHFRLLYKKICAS
jgi:hypothetical protein